jgi:hypothetical protein
VLRRIFGPKLEETAGGRSKFLEKLYNLNFLLKTILFGNKI